MGEQGLSRRTGPGDSRLRSPSTLLDVSKGLPEPKHGKDSAAKHFLTLWHEAYGSLEAFMALLGCRVWTNDDDDAGDGWH